MIVMVPNEDYRQHQNTVNDIIATLSWENWTTWLNKLYPSDFDVGLPKFKITLNNDLAEILKALGMEIAFDKSRADFSNVFDDKRGWLSAAVQKTFIQVDERGTEAATIR